MDDAYGTGEDTPFTTGNVLDNDWDIDLGDTLSVESYDGSTLLGLLTSNGDGTFDYDPNGQFEGLAEAESFFDVFTYRVTDGVLTDTATVTITITGVNDAPAAVDDAYGTDEDTPLTVAAPGVLDNDWDIDLSDTLSVDSYDDSGLIGLLTLDANGGFTYDPNGQFEGLAEAESFFDVFTYVVTDGVLTDTATVTITIAGVNDAPVAVDDAYGTDEDTAVVIALVASDIEGETLNWDVGDPAHGMLDGSAPDLTYTPDADWSGTDTFTFIVNDGTLDSNVATVTIIVGAVNDNPLVNAGIDLTADEGSPVAFSGSYNDPGLRTPSAVDITWTFGDGEMATGTLAPSHTYAENDIYTVTLIVTDELGGVGTDWLLVTVENVAPELSPIDDVNVMSGETFSVTAVFIDPSWLDTHTLTVAWSDGITETVPLLNGTQAYLLSHAYAETGTYTVAITITDDDGGADMITLSVTVENAGYFTYLPMVRR